MKKRGLLLVIIALASVAAILCAEDPPSPRQLARTYGAESRTLLKSDEKKAGLAKFTKAIEAVKMIRKRKDQDEIFEEMGAVFTDSGLYEQTAAIAIHMSESTRMSNLVSAAVKHCARNDKIERAIRIAQSIKNETAKLQTLQDVSEEYARQSRFEDALKAADAINHTHVFWARAMAEIGRQYARNGEIDKGLEIVKKIQRGSFARNEAFRDIANICTDNGDYKRACKIVDLIPVGSDLRDQIHVHASNYFRRMGDLPLALEAIDSVSPASALARTIGLSRISRAYTDQGDYKNGLKLARRMPRGNHLRAQTMQHLVYSLMDNDHDEEAIDLAEGIAVIIVRNETFTGICRRLMAKGNNQLAAWLTKNIGDADLKRQVRKELGMPRP